jgi:hypothetical protein
MKPIQLKICIIITNWTAPVSGVYVSMTGANSTTGSDGKYSLRVTDGTYTVNASKRPNIIIKWSRMWL